MLNAIIENKNGDTANIDLTTHYFELYKELQAVGYCAFLRDIPKNLR